jgi:hypothetical protein
MVQAYKERKALVLQWDANGYKGPVTIETTNSADVSDISSTELVSNPGFAAVSFPLDYTGSFQVRVLDGEGNEIDNGELDVA